MQNRAFSLLLCLSIFLVACTSKELTRSKAAKIIKTDLKFPQDVTDTMSTGRAYVPQTNLQALLTAPMVGPYMKAMIDAHLVTLEWKGMGNQNAWQPMQGIVECHLTDKGRRYVQSENPLPGQPLLTQVTIKLCEKDFDEVTGISDISDVMGGGKKVDYTWKFVHPTPFEIVDEKTIGKEKSPCGSAASRTGSVAMKLYDDGWRLVP